MNRAKWNNLPFSIVKNTRVEAFGPSLSRVQHWNNVKSENRSKSPLNHWVHHWNLVSLLSGWGSLISHWKLTFTWHLGLVLKPFLCLNAVSPPAIAILASIVRRAIWLVGLDLFTVRETRSLIGRGLPGSLTSLSWRACSHWSMNVNRNTWPLG